MSRRQRGLTLIEMTIVVLVIGILAAVAFPNYLRARKNSRTSTCIANLKRIEDAKELWAMETHASATASPTETQLLGSPTEGYMQTWPTCPENGTYTIGDMSTRPTCTTAEHVLP